MAVPEIIAEFARERCGKSVEVSMVPLRGGLESEGIARVEVRDSGKCVSTFVAKPLHGGGARELATYRQLARTEHKHIAPELLGWGEGYMPTLPCPTAIS